MQYEENKKKRRSQNGYTAEPDRARCSTHYEASLYPSSLGETEGLCAWMDGMVNTGGLGSGEADGLGWVVLYWLSCAGWYSCNLTWIEECTEVQYLHQEVNPLSDGWVAQVRHPAIG
jgi:hypothetical protein